MKRCRLKRSSKREWTILYWPARASARAHSIAASRTSTAARNNSHLFNEHDPTYLATFLEWLDNLLLLPNALYIDLNFFRVLRAYNRPTAMSLTSVGIKTYIAESTTTMKIRNKDI